MAVDIASIPTEEKDARLETIVNGKGGDKLRDLHRLRSDSVPTINMVIDNLSDELGLVSEINLKSDRAALNKARRPAIIARYPWFTLAHLRDFLRFRTHLRSPDDFEAVLEVFLRLRSEGVIEIVKIDTEKLLAPGAFGWRMLATDLRVTLSGMLVEHYMTFSELIRVNQEWLHEVYERWRDRYTDYMTIRETERFYGDARFSTHAYRELFLDGVVVDRASTGAHKEDRDAATERMMATLKRRVNLP